MATYLIASKADKAKARKITQMIEDGTKAQPPALEGKLNECANPKCGKSTVLARFYVPRVGHCCKQCFDEWRLTPVWCDTCAGDVHRGRFHVALGIFEEAPSKTPTAAPAHRSDTKTTPDWVSTQVAKIKAQRGAESLATEARWHEMRRQREARINDVCHWRYRRPITEEKAAA